MNQTVLFVDGPLAGRTSEVRPSPALAVEFDSPATGPLEVTYELDAAASDDATARYRLAEDGCE